MRQSLEQARDHLEAGHYVDALKTLLEAWEERRVPAIADVIDRVSALLTKGPVTAKTVKARTEKWLEIANRGAPEDLGALLVTPWPGTWKHAKPLVEVIARSYPRDPRLALALAKIVDATPYDTWTSVQFYRPLFDCMNRIGDIRTLPILEAQAKRRKSGYWRASTGKLETAAVQQLKETFPKGAPPLLTAEEDAVFQLIAAHFSGDVAAEQSKARGEQDFLADIYRSPEDDAERQVFADWLSERGDPRGEFITIQLAQKAGRSSEAMQKREAALLKKHVKEWLGPLDRVTNRHHRVFEGGFLADVMLETGGYTKKPNEELLHPSWATVHSITVPWNMTYEPALCQAVLDLPGFAFLHTIRGLSEANVSRLVEKGVPRPRIKDLDVSFNLNAEATAGPNREALDGGGKIFPALERLTFSARMEDIPVILTSAFAHNVKRIAFRGYDLPLGPFVRIVTQHQRHLPRLEEIAVVQVARYTMRRDAKTSRFTRLFAAGIDDRSIPTRYELERVLLSIINTDPNAITELAVPAGECTYGERDIESLEATLAKLPKLETIDVPWERVQKSKLDASVSAVFSLTLTGGSSSRAFFDEARIRKMIELGRPSPPLSFAFDSYAVNDGKHTALPVSSNDADAADVFDTIHSVLTKKRTRSMRLYTKGAVGASRVTIQPSAWSIGFGWKVDGGKKQTDALARFVLDLIDGDESIEYGNLGFRVGDREVSYPFGPFRWTPQLGFLSILGPSRRGVLDFDAILALSESKEHDLPWLRVLRSKSGSHLLLIAGDTPFGDGLDEARRNRVAELLWRITSDGIQRAEGFVPHTLARSMLGPVMRDRGFKDMPLTPLQQAQGQIYFYLSDKRGSRSLELEMTDATQPAARSWWIRAKRAKERDVDLLTSNADDVRWISKNTAQSKDDATKTLEALIQVIEDDLTKWWA